MAKKNRIFSGLDQQGKPKQPGDEYVPKYYGQSKTRRENKERAVSATEKFRQAELDPNARTGKTAQERFTIIMEALPQKQRDILRNKVESGEYYSSGDLLDAAQEIADEVDGVKYFSKYQLDKKLKEIANRPPDEDINDILDNLVF